MSGITTESRLARLERLRAQLDQEIAVERALEKRRTRIRRLHPPIPKPAPEPRMPASATVREWARKYGHPVSANGRVPDALMRLYLEANPEPTFHTDPAVES